jgi:hypothetical protein
VEQKGRSWSGTFPVVEERGHGEGGTVAPGNAGSGRTFAAPVLLVLPPSIEAAPIVDALGVGLAVHHVSKLEDACAALHSTFQPVRGARHLVG